MSVQGAVSHARTDRTGRFLLRHIPAGRDILVIDGNHADSKRHFGIYEIGVAVKNRKTTVLDYTVWLTALDPAGNKTIPSPSRKAKVLTTPEIPGLEVKLPAGTVVHDASGHVTKHLNITAVPVDRSPFPVPPFLQVPAYFTVQPGGAYLSEGAQIVYPNYGHLRPGSRVEFWNYDATDRGWYVYGHGTVTRNGKQVVPDPGVRVWQFTGAMINSNVTPPALAPTSCGCDGGDPVDLSSGLFMHTETDFVLPDTLPLVLSSTYRELDSNSYSFGVGTASVFDMRLWSTNNYQTASLVLPSGAQVKYVRTSPGTGWLDAIYTATATTGEYYNSTISYDTSIPNGGGWDLRLRSGLIYVFGDNAPLQAIRDRNGNQITLTRTNGQTGNITQVTSQHGRWIQFTYDSSNRITQAQDNTGRTYTYSYNAAGYLASVTDPMGHVTTYHYDSSGDMTEIDDARGKPDVHVSYTTCDTVYVSGNYRRLGTRLRPDDGDVSGGSGGTDSPPPVTCIIGLVAAETNADNDTYQFKYSWDQNANITSATVTDPDGNQETVTFNADHYPIDYIEAAGSNLNQETKVQRQSGTDMIQSITDPLGRTTTYSYDTNGNVTQMTQMAGTSEARTWTNTYDPTYNQVTSATDPLGHTTTYDYDDRGNLTSVTDPLGRQTTTSYNGAGQPTSVTDPVGNTTTLHYLNGDLTGITDPLGRTTTAFVDGAGRTLAITDPEGNTTRYAYDPDNEITRITDPNGGQTSFAYDPDGDLTQLTDARGHTTTATYDDADEEVSQTGPLGRVSSWVHDPDGNIASYTDPALNTLNFAYDPLGRLTEVSYPSSSVTYGYDAGNRPVSAADSSGASYTASYDDFDNLTAENGPNGAVSYTYDAADRRTSMSAPGSLNDSYSYDNADDLTSVAGPGGTASMSYDGDSRLQTLTLPDGITENYGYDAASEPTSIVYDHGGSQLGDLDYGYDQNGNENAVWGSYARTNLPAPIGSASYDADNELTSNDGTNSSYDQDGNLTNDGTNTYSWNDRGELSQVSGPSGTQSYTYDPSGRRLTKTANGSTTGYLYDGDTVIEELNGGTPSAQMLTGPGTDQILARTTSTGTDSYLTDQLGSTIQLADQNANPTTSYTYDPFGQTTTSGPTSTNPYQYTGGVNDGNALQYNLARYYNPATASFTSPDPLGLAGSGTNEYGYANGDPIDTTDPLGLFGISDILNGISNGVSSFGQILLNTGISDFARGALDTLTGGLSEDIACSFGAAPPGEGFTAGQWAVMPFAILDGAGEADAAESAGGLFARLRGIDWTDETGSIDFGARRSLPRQGIPDSTDVIDRGNGTGQIRDYGPDGWATKDFDFGYDHGAGDPHAHDWINGDRQPGRSILPGE